MNRQMKERAGMRYGRRMWNFHALQESPHIQLAESSTSGLLLRLNYVHLISKFIGQASLAQGACQRLE